MSDDEVVELGLRAEALLGSHTFKFVIEHLAESYTNNILSSDPNAVATREMNYHLHHALNDVVAQLGAYAAAAQAIVDEGEQKDQQ